MKILVIGSGGREHALIWKLSQDRPDAQIYAAPGNGGTKALAESVPLKSAEIDGLTDFAASREIDFTVVGPEAPLAAGIVDRFIERELAIFGPRQGAAQIESSKAFAKELMARAGVPTAEHRWFDDFQAAKAYILERGAPIVVKASGLAAGKGSIVCPSEEKAIDAARSMLDEGRFGAAGATIIVEEFLEGEELSLLVVSDGVNAVPLVASQDHKPIGEGDTGPNTGGMGAYAPVSIADSVLVDRAMERIVHPTLGELRDRERPYRGVLYCGLMVADGDPYVIEFNCRFGDPETQALLPLLQSSLVDLIEPVARGYAVAEPPRWRAASAVCTVLASEGYPGEYEKGRVIDIPAELEDDPGVLLFHAGTRVDPEHRLVTDGGRVLGVVGLGDSTTDAARKSREAAEAITFTGKYFRRDIGHREVKRERGE